MEIATKSNVFSMKKFRKNIMKNDNGMKHSGELRHVIDQSRDLVYQPRSGTHPGQWQTVGNSRLFIE